MDEKKENKGCCGGGGKCHHNVSDAQPPDDAQPDDNASGQQRNLKDSIANYLSSCGPEVFDMVKSHLVEEELKRRRDDILKGLAKLDELKQNLRKIKPDQECYGEDGKLSTATYSKAKADELKKAKEQIAKVENAIEKALNIEKPDFSKLRECAGK